MWWLEETVSVFEGFNISALNTDEAWINITSSIEKPLWIYILSDDCHSCSYQKFLEDPILKNHTYKAIASTRHGSSFRLRTSGDFNYTPSYNDSFKFCDLQSNLGEFGVYSIFVHSDAQSQTLVQCSLTNDLEPVNIYLPILVTLIFGLILVTILKCGIKHWAWLKMCLKRLYFETLALFTSNNADNEHHEDEARLIPANEESHGTETEPKNVHLTEETCSQRKAVKRKKKTIVQTGKTGQAEAQIVNDAPSASSSRSVEAHSRDPVVPAVPKERLKSLDTFRGVCIMVMIIADDGGGGYYFLQHSTWDGLYIADLAFPWFIWICGVSIPFAIHARFVGGASKIKILKETLARALKLILMGIMVNTSTRATAVQLENLRLPGVLQRFGICYFIGSALLLLFYNENTTSQRNNSVEDENQFSWKSFADFKSTIIPWCFVLIIVGFHTAIIFLLPVPNCPRGYLGPAGLHNNSAFPPTCVGGAVGYIDRLIFGQEHIHNHPTSKRVYGSGPFDPEGALGILTSVLHIWLGVQAGVIFLTYKSVKLRVIRLLSMSAICGAAGFVLCGGVSNLGWIPINKNLWSLSFVLVTSSFSFVFLLVLYLIIDVRQNWNGSPLIETGRNSILLYMGHEVCHAMLPWHFSYGRMISHASKLMETSWGTALWVLIGVYLYERQLFFVV